MRTPLWKALCHYVQEDRHSTHTPGHKDGRLLPSVLREAWGETFFRYDATEVPGLDNLAHPEGALEESMQAWAEARGCAAVQYLLGGTSLGLKAALYALAQGEKVFVPRHVHHSIYQGLVLSGAEPIYLPVTLEDGVPLGIAPETLAQAIDEHPDCHLLVVVHPTYHGFVWQNEALIGLAKRAGLTVIVDEAHGAHFAHPALPSSALTYGADVVVASAHKTLPCLTQASVMYIRESAMVHPLRQAVALLHTTSPSYLLMASLEQSGAWLFGEGQAIISQGVKAVERLYERLNDVEGLEVMQAPQGEQDPFKCYLVSAFADGERFAEALRQEGLECEMSDSRGVLLMLGLDGGSPTLADIITRAHQRLGKSPCPKKPLCYLPHLPEAVVDVREAWLAPSEQLPLRQCLGRVAAELLEAYPPGIPLAVPGERINAEVLAIWEASGHSLQQPFAVMVERSSNV